MKRFKIGTLFFACLPITSYSADFNDCKVIEIITAGANNGHVLLDCTIEPVPVCAVAPKYFGFDKSTDEGKQYMSVVLTAFASGATLSGYVNDTSCSPYQGNVALLEHLRMKK
ncbi:hypothetical protein [Paraglaciecola sp.]|uniref:hypothetical protein n=1 Tax=Paraglaciecola sp. TaxID=1920173 RepID=UPI003263CC11